MISNVQAFRQYLRRREEAIELKKISVQGKSLFNEKDFYPAFTRDLLVAKQEVIIYSPFASKFRTDCLKPIIEKLRYRNVDVFIFTRPLEEYDNIIRPQIEIVLKRFEEMGVCIFYPGRYIHEKVAIIDRQVLWEGSLNILSHRSSNEMMRRIESKESAMEVMEHIRLNEPLAEAYKVKYERMYRGLIRKKKIDRRRLLKITLGVLILIFLALSIGFLLYLKSWQQINIMSVIEWLNSHSGK